MNRRICLIALCLLVAVAAILTACTPKTTGSQNPAADDDDDDDSSPSSPLGANSINLNMVAVDLSNVATKLATVFDGSGKSTAASVVALADLIGGLQPFADDAAKFQYEFANYYEQSNLAGGSLVAWSDMSKVALYVGADQDLHLGWLEPGHDKNCLDHMGKGWIVTHPIAGAFDGQTLAYVDERTGDNPTHLGEVAAIDAIVTTGTGVMVEGSSYLKMFLQQNGYGVKVFGDVSATQADQGYDGSLLKNVSTFEGDEVWIKGRVTVNNGMIEFVPVSGYHIAQLSRNNKVEAPAVNTIAALAAAPYRWAGALVRIDGVELTDVNPSDPTTDWPAYGSKSKDILIRQGSGKKIGMPVYEGAGIPGLFKPTGAFDVVGAFHIDGQTLEIYPRKIEDINPTTTTLAGSIKVDIAGESTSKTVNLTGLPASMQQVAQDDDPVAVVSLASVAAAAGVTRNPKLLDFKHAAYDGRTPFDTLSFDQLKSGLLYQDKPTDDSQPNPMVSSYFWSGMNLSAINFLKGVTRVHGFRQTTPPQEGDAVHGKGVTLKINDKKYAINFDSVLHTDYDGQDAIAMNSLVSDLVIDLFTMDGSFTTAQIKMLYDYRLVSYDGKHETTVKVDDMGDGYLIMADPPYTEFPDLGADSRVDDLYTIDMVRFMEVDLGDGSDPIVVHLRDCDTQLVDIGGGVMENVVFFGEVLSKAGIDTTQGMYLHDYWLIASDNFISKWPYQHHHLVNMYFRPDADRGYTTDATMSAYGGRVSTKAVYEIQLHDVPQSTPSVPVVESGETIWGSDANTCDGCHFRDGALNLPVNCYSCHTAP